ncbi:MAG TPA: tetratricopeptide repeat protein [Pyrinomonadaceae bacterium]|mgnify:CR=1 FL=1|nr:tetratricopeptide repeat protein [Pyrinomonadaceae bacterium]
MKRNFFTGFMTVFFVLTIFSFAPGEAFAQPKKAKKLVEDGNKMFARQNYQGAVDKYAEAIVIAPKYADAYFWKGTSHYYLEQFEQGIKDLSNALTFGYKKPLEIYKLRGYMNLQQQNYDAALIDATEASKIEPSNIVFVTAMGEAYLGKKDWENAITTYQRASQLAPQNGDINYFLAFSYSQTGNVKEQGTFAAEAIKKGTRYVGEAYYLYGDAQQKARNQEDAIQAFERSLSAKPDIYATYSALSELYRNQGRFQDAIATTLRGLENFPNDGGLYVNLTWYYSLADKHVDAIQAGQNAVKYAPNNATGYTNLCRAYNDTKQYSSAIETCNKALAILPDDGETNFYLGRSYSFLNREDTAKKYYAKAVTGLIKFTNENPDYSDGFYLLGNAHFANGNRDKAIEAYRQCLNLSPRFSKAKVNLGYIYFLKGDTQAARQQYDELKKFDNLNAERLKQLMEQK